MKKVRQRSLAAVLVVALLVSMFGIFNFNLSADSLIDIGNHPALKGFVSGTAPSQEYWSYNIKDYGTKAAMQVSSTDFKAPTAVWDIDNEKVTFEWTAVNGAASYTVNVYEGETLADSFAGVTANTYSSAFAQTDLVSGTDYEVQVVAYDASGAVLSASCIRKFTAAAVLKYDYTILDFNDATANQTVSKYYRCVSYNSTTSDGRLCLNYGGDAIFTFFKMPKMQMDNAAAIVFKMDSDLPFTGNFALAFGASADVTSSVTGASYTAIKDRNSKFAMATVDSSITAVPASDPSKYKTASTISKSGWKAVSLPESVAEDSNGYYLVFPLSMFTENIQKDLKAGIFDVIGFQGFPNGTKVKQDGEWVSGDKNTKVVMEFDEIFYITDTNAWLDQLQQNYSEEVYEKNTSYAFAGDLGVLNADTFNAAQDTLANDNFSGAKYKFQSNTTARRVTFTSVSSFTNKYGANMTFTAEEGGYYDLANKLEVVNNDSVTDATVNYRIVKTSADGNREIVYPYDTSIENWYSLIVSADNKNPSGDISAPMVYLKAGEKLTIEAYADIPAGGSLEINLGNPTTTPVTFSENYKGSTYTWSYGNYVPNFVYDGGTSNVGGINNSSFHQTGRWTERLLQIDSATGNEEYIDFPTHNMGWGLTGKRTAPTAGFYYYTATNRGQEMKVETVGNGYAVSFQYTAPMSGSATLTFNANSKLRYRVIVNGEQVYPASGWDVSTSVSAPLSLNSGDVVMLDVMHTVDGEKKIVTCKSPQITMSFGNEANAVGDHTFAALWERPYNGKNYTGDFAHLSGSLWNFKTSDFSSTSAIKSYDANYYSSTDKSLYYKDDDGNVKPEAKYIFADEQLKAVINSKSNGISLTFTAAEAGYYDFSTAVNLLDGTYNASVGAGDIRIRVLAAGKTVWPASGEWYAADDVKLGEGVKVDATEVFLDAGKTLVLQVYASGLTSDDTTGTPVPMVIGLGSPAVQHINTRVFTDTGSSTVYIPSDFTVMEKGYSGTYIPVDSRFNVTFGGKTAATTDTASGTMAVDSNNKVVYDPETGEMSLVISAGNTAAVEFVSPMDGTGKYEIVTPATSGVTYRLLQNGKILTDWSATLPASTDITAAKGDTFTLEVKTTANTQISFETFNISLMGMHNNPNSATDSAFYAAFAVPYGDSKYIGKFTEDKNSYWKFNLYDVNADEIVKANYYDYNTNKKLYNTDMQDAGYYFVDQNNRMNADIYTSQDEKYGLSLGFAAPAADTFNFRSGLQLETDTTATFMLRLIQVNADGVATTVWPADSDEDGWYEQTVAQNEDITIPHAELTFNEGDTVYLQLYAKESEVEELNISLASPGFMKDSPITIEHADIGARIYDCTKYNPYSHFDYSGDFTTTNYVPMENRWNLEYISIDHASGELLGVINPDYYRIGTSGAHELMYKGYNGLLWLNYHSNKTPMGIGRYSSGDAYEYQYVGSQKRFIAPSTATYQINSVTPNLKTNIEGGSVRYRITKVSAATGVETVLWPSAEAIESNTTLIWESADGTAWELLNSENMNSSAEDFEIELEVGDQIKFQMYNYATTDDLNTYITNNPDLEKAKWSASCGVTPQIIVIDYINEKSIHSLNTGWLGNYQLSPYWKIQTADGDGEPYRDNTRYSWNYWLDTKYSLLGISSLQKWNFQKYKENTWTDEITPVISARFTVSSDGYLSSKGTAKFIGSHFVDEAGTIPVNIKARITLNGENLYPASGWSTITNGTPYSYDIKSVEVKAGDIIRYELMYDNGGENVYIQWNPTLTISKYADIYNYTDDIYNVLTDEMTAHFKSLKSQTFQKDNSLSLALSKAIAARKAAAAAIGPEYSGMIGDDTVIGNTGNNEIISGDPGDYREWTEEIYTPGGGYRKIRRVYVTSWWIYALIIAGGVILLAGITVLTVILVKKKRKKSAKSKT